MSGKKAFTSAAIWQELKSDKLKEAHDKINGD